VDHGQLGQECLCSLRGTPTNHQRHRETALRRPKAVWVGQAELGLAK
jgi:hypothetical protein